MTCDTTCEGCKERLAAVLATLTLPDVPDLRWHQEFRRGYAACLDDLRKLVRRPSKEGDDA